MANPDHLAILQQGVETWNQWRAEHPDIQPDLLNANLQKWDLRNIDFDRTQLGGADLSETDLSDSELIEANLSYSILNKTNLSRSNLNKAILFRANLGRANLQNSTLQDGYLVEADFGEANLMNADLTKAILNQAKLVQTNLEKADLSGTILRGAVFFDANLQKAKLIEANCLLTDFTKANLSEANLSRSYLRRVILDAAILTGADLQEASLIETKLANANISNAYIYGISSWNNDLPDAIQTNLIITPYHEPTLTVDDLEIAQFLYLLLNNDKLRGVIDTLTTKAVLILGRFKDERKAVLDAIRDDLRRRGYVPILFDFDKPVNRDLTETVLTLASLSRFVIADLSDPNSIPHELMSFAEKLLSVPIQPIFIPTPEHPRPYPMLEHLQRYTHVLPTYHYDTQDNLIAALADQVIAPAEAKVAQMRPPPL